jgi:hypothetical protein
MKLVQVSRARSQPASLPNTGACARSIRVLYLQGGNAQCQHILKVKLYADVWLAESWHVAAAAG